MTEIAEFLLDDTRKRLPAVMNSLGQRIINNECSLFLGSGMSLNSNLPSWHQLLKPCADELNLNIEAIHDLFSLAQYYANVKSESNLRRIVGEQISLLAHATNVHDRLISSGFKSIWTTNYDHLIEQSLQAQGIAYNPIISDSDLANVTYQGKVNVYKINGDISRREEMVLTRGDIERYNRTHKLFLTFLRKELVSNTFLFVGYSFSDGIVLDCLSEIRDYLKLQTSFTTHYALMVIDGTEDDSIKYKIDDLKRRYGIDCLFILKDQFESFIDLLWRRLRYKKVFISGAYHFLSEEEEHFADSLSEKIVRKLYSEHFRISTGIGKRLGAFITGYANQYLIANGYTNTSQYLSMRPFPFHLLLDEKTKVKYRTIMQKDCDSAIFMFGRSETTSKEGPYDQIGHYSRGVYQEYQIAKSMGSIIIPLGSTGYEAQIIWQEVKNNINEYPYLSKKIDALGATKDPECLSEILISILNECARHNAV